LGTQQIHAQRLHPEKYTLELTAVKASNVLQSNNRSDCRLLSKSESYLRQANLFFIITSTGKTIQSERESIL